MTVFTASEDLGALLQSVQPATRADTAAVQRHLDDLTKPPGSLGYLEDLALRLALIYGDPPPPLRRRTVFVLAADHGVARRGVSAYPPEVTAQMCRNFATGGAAINVIARAVGADVVVVDIGVNADLESVSGLLHRKVRRGTRDLGSESALTRGEVVSAVLTGAALVRERGNMLDAVALGEMGIGNTTAASALAAAFTGRPVDELVGPGTGLTPERMAYKRAVIEQALRRLRTDADVLDLLAEVGGLEIAGLAGVAIEAASMGLAVVTDGFIATAAALAAVRLCPPVRDYIFASHVSSEPGHRVLLGSLGLRPLFELDLRLGEGTGAALALPILDAAGSLLREMATSSSAGISGPS